ncbi:hypothetical protein EVAR_24206_1 [Eumeta japonica]|uniref:Uncharacterized protein n=1 Tax=Eumeta variegata TaxID=151549 RepID=A0A4C1W4S8_EUMVA|nr:hypothetical protein EVAR_24206_1 [Eumeta japonica]
MRNPPLRPAICITLVEASYRGFRIQFAHEAGALRGVRVYMSMTHACHLLLSLSSRQRPVSGCVHGPLSQLPLARLQNGSESRSAGALPILRRRPQSRHRNGIAASQSDSSSRCNIMYAIRVYRSERRAGRPRRGRAHRQGTPRTEAVVGRTSTA